MTHTQIQTARCAALVGPYLSGKTSLLESLLSAAGATTRKGSVRDGNAVGDSSPEAKARQMSVEVNVASFEFLGERWSVLDCPGSVELACETQSALMVADVAVIVAEAAPEKAVLLAPLFKFLDDNRIPHLLFINKVDSLGDLRVRDVVQAYQAVSARKLVLREVPIREGGKITGFVDLVSERAWHFNPHKPSNLVQIPDSLKDREHEARQEMLEAVADYDDALLEKLLEDVAPDTQEVYDRLASELADDLIVPVFFGSAENDNGIRRLLKALRHEGPDVATSAERAGIPADATVAAQVFKTLNGSHAGKISLVRVWRGTVSDGMTLGGERVSGVFRMMGHNQEKLSQAAAGEVVALGRLDKAATGDLLTDKGNAGRSPLWPELPPPVFGLALHAQNRNDEVKLTAAIQKLVEEDPSLRLDQSTDTGELVLWGQGDIHLQIAMDRLRNKFNVSVKGVPPQVPYRESIRKGTAHHARYKRQTGGHGQFADIHVEVKPLPRGTGFQFEDGIVGGVVPRQFIPAVETGVRDYAVRGPLGFPVVDFAVKLTGGQFHAVDSSEMAFKTVARQAMTEALPACEPVLLEPILTVSIAVPSDFTSKVQRLVSGRRGQILGYDARPGWQGWDEVKAYLPQAEMHDLIVELRSLSLGVGTFTWSFERLQELTGKAADKAVEIRKETLAAQ
ncbi:elongation factor G [Azospirillum brasilense]|uniref:Elongation factor G n=1 Tax=Azospirillum brasilense TaxID=192 RepID=A0ABU4P607_AZOBR|nr:MULTISPECIES: elongation factor G [Azospirillum]ALJ34529.1 elongation factor G [Azospirillum brasilense]MDW7554122.1 elongation factor G [Azospirillum brasilense]MDW7592911.1 elongation factor G [Azospirillum brasilense]MDW7593619.1 elongation factor G [Azospirillum brasilense]MDW7627138.1 elongation factor G [Azospirillum brasilense]